MICTRNRPEELNQCLEAVKRLTYPRFDVLVVDNAPADERARMVAGRWGARYTVEPVVGLSRARNRGARECGTEIVAYLDDDSIPEPEWLGAVVREFEDSQVMVVGGQTLPLSLETEAQRRALLLRAASFSTLAMYAPRTALPLTSPIGCVLCSCRTDPGRLLAL